MRTNCITINQGLTALFGVDLSTESVELSLPSTVNFASPASFKRTINVKDVEFSQYMRCY